MAYTIHGFDIVEIKTAADMIEYHGKAIAGYAEICATNGYRLDVKTIEHHSKQIALYTARINQLTAEGAKRHA